MPRKILLKRQPYTISYNNNKHTDLRVVLNADCGLKKGDRVFQFKRKDGVIELVPETLVDLQKF